MNNSKTEKLINLWYFITVFAIIILCIKYALPIVLPFILAAAVAAFIRKPINSIAEKANINRNIISFFAVFLVTLILVALISLLIYSIYVYLSDVLVKLPTMLPKLKSFTAQISNIFNQITDSMPQTLTEAITQMPSKLISAATEWLTGILANIVGKLPSFIVAVGVTVFASFLITRDYYKLGKFINSILPKSSVERIVRYKAIAGNKFAGMIKGYVILTVITYIVLLIGFLLLKISYAPAVASIIAFIDLLPILGSGVVLIPWSAICLFSGEIGTAIGLLTIYAIAMLLHNILSPRILGNQIKLDSLTVLVSMYVGFKAFGITGMILSPFIAAIIRDVFMEQ